MAGIPFVLTMVYSTKYFRDEDVNMDVSSSDGGGPLICHLHKKSLESCRYSIKKVCGVPRAIVQLRERC